MVEAQGAVSPREVCADTVNHQPIRRDVCGIHVKIVLISLVCARDFSCPRVSSQTNTRLTTAAIWLPTMAWVRMRSPFLHTQDANQSGTLKVLHALEAALNRMLQAKEYSDSESAMRVRMTRLQQTHIYIWPFPGKCEYDDKASLHIRPPYDAQQPLDDMLVDFLTSISLPSPTIEGGESVQTLRNREVR